jgi:hypothetical protein
MKVGLFLKKEGKVKSRFPKLRRLMKESQREIGFFIFFYGRERFSLAASL